MSTTPRPGPYDQHPGDDGPLRLPGPAQPPPPPEPTPSSRSYSRRGILATAAAAASLAAVGAVAVLATRDDPQPGADGVDGTDDGLPHNDSDPSGDDETETLQALLDEGQGRVVIPAGTHVISSTLTVPWEVDTVELPAGAVLHMRGDEIALRRSGEVEPTVRTVTRAVEGESTVALDAAGLEVDSWVYLCSDDWVKVDKSKMGMLRRVVAVGPEGLTVDKPLIRTLLTNPRAHKVTLAPAFTLTGEGAIENGDPQGTFSNLVRLDFVRDIEVSGVELRDCGDAAVRTFGTVGGVVDCYIHDLVDDQDNNHYGYGVSCTSTTRDLRVLGTIERVRHAFTTDHGYDAPNTSIGHTGEPEDIYVAPVVRRTTSTGIDTHEPGYGITIVPDIADCGTNKWGGMNIRARNVTIEGGSISASNEWGILVQESASGTVVRGVTIDGIQTGRGIHCKSDTEIDGVTVSGFGDAFGIEVIEGVAVTMRNTRIDGGGVKGSRGIVLAGTASSMQGTVANCAIGVLRLPAAGENSLDLVFENVARQEVVST